MTNGTLYTSKWDCAATGSGTRAQNRGSKTTSGGCNSGLADQWETAAKLNLRNGLGLATPGAMPTAPSQGILTSTTFPNNAQRKFRKPDEVVGSRLQ